MLNVPIVDDMDIVRRELRRFKLWGESTGFVICAEAKNGEEALEVLEANQIDLVISDIEMPKIDGMQLLRKIEERGLCPCVVLFSDYTDFNNVRQGLVLGAFDYLAKPVNEEDLARLLTRAKDFILERYLQRERVQGLEQRLEEKVEVFFPKTDVKHIKALIEEGDLNCIKAVERMVAVTITNLGFDLLKLETVLKNVLLEIENTLFADMKWLNKFIQKDCINNINFIQCRDINSMSSILTNRVEKFCSLIKLLRFGRKGDDIVGQVIDCVLTSPEVDISLKDVAEKLFMNRTYVSEAFKQKSGIPLVEYLTSVKMERAKKLLADDNMKSCEIAAAIGYKDVEYFSRQFKKYTGITPSEFRHNNKY